MENHAVGYRLEELYLEITNACPHHCIHCSARSGKPYPNELSLREMQQLIIEAKSLGLHRLYLTGGEPFTHPEYILQLINIAGKDIESIILTNGEIFTKSMAEELASFGQSVRLEMSIFSASSDIHDRLAGTQGSLTKMLRSVNGYIEQGIDVRWSFILTRANINEIDGVLQLASKIGIKRVSILRIVPAGRARDNWSHLKIELDQFAWFLNHLEEIKCIYNTKVITGRPLSYKFVESGIQPSSCSAAISKMLIQADGNAFPCPAFKDLPVFWGKNVRTNSLREVWFYSSAFNRLRSYSPGPETPCFGCMYVNTCKGHCRAHQLYTYGTLYRGSDPLCPIILYNKISDMAQSKGEDSL